MDIANVRLVTGEIASVVVVTPMRWNRYSILIQDLSLPGENEPLGAVLSSLFKYLGLREEDFEKELHNSYRSSQGFGKKVFEYPKLHALLFHLILSLQHRRGKQFPFRDLLASEVAVEVIDLVRCDGQSLQITLTCEESSHALSLIWRYIHGEYVNGQLI